MGVFLQKQCYTNYLWITQALKVSQKNDIEFTSGQWFVGSFGPIFLDIFLYCYNLILEKPYSYCCAHSGWKELRAAPVKIDFSRQA